MTYLGMFSPPYRILGLENLSLQPLRPLPFSTAQHAFRKES